jgi:hypothetical protein
LIFERGIMKNPKEKPKIIEIKTPKIVEIERPTIKEVE